MATWTDLSAAFGYGTKLTSQQQQQLRDNITALAEGASGAPEIAVDAIEDWEAVGDNNYYEDGGPLGGAENSVTHDSWHTYISLRFCTKCEIRFYWGIRQEQNNYWVYGRIQQNGVSQDTNSMQGSSGADSISWKTTDLTIEKGDIITIDAYTPPGATYPAELYAYLRGEYLSAIYELNGDIA